jgi:hypothetical protein
MAGSRIMLRVGLALSRKRQASDVRLDESPGPGFREQGDKTPLCLWSRLQGISLFWKVYVFLWSNVLFLNVSYH